MGIEYKFDLMLSTDGSGRGAALVAAVLMGECKIWELCMKEMYILHTIFKEQWRILFDNRSN